MSPVHAPNVPDRFILPDVQPLVSELDEPVTASVLLSGDPRRASADAFVRSIFADAYRAKVCSSYPALLTFEGRNGERAAVGLRDASRQTLFAEQYLDATVGDALHSELGVSVPRTMLVEVGNLALCNGGDARWVIAATTLFLHALGYRFAIFTATRMLQNTFRRLGLQPVSLTRADPARVSNGGDDWGEYYGTRPVVCAGRISSGYRKLVEHSLQHQPYLHALLADVRGLASRSAACVGGSA